MDGTCIQVTRSNFPPFLTNDFHFFCGTCYISVLYISFIVRLNRYDKRGILLLICIDLLKFHKNIEQSWEHLWLQVNGLHINSCLCSLFGLMQILLCLFISPKTYIRYSLVELVCFTQLTGDTTLRKRGTRLQLIPEFSCFSSLISARI